MCVCVNVLCECVYVVFVCGCVCMHVCMFVCVCVQCVCACMCVQELGKYLGGVVDVVSQLALRDGDVGEVAMELLRYLLLEKTDATHATIASLDPLPRHPVLAQMTQQCERIQQKAGRRSFPKVNCREFAPRVCVCVCLLVVFC